MTLYDDEHPEGYLGLTKEEYGRFYYRGYIRTKNHPPMPATGTEGLCELCEKKHDDPIHAKPYEDDGLGPVKFPPGYVPA
jgi:hypothetical protein